MELCEACRHLQAPKPQLEDGSAYRKIETYMLDFAYLIMYTWMDFLGIQDTWAWQDTWPRPIRLHIRQPSATQGNCY